MNFFNRIGDDFKYRFLQDVGVLDIVFVALFVVALVVTFSAKLIAKRYCETQEVVLRLAIKIKSIAFITTAVLALIITQVL